MVLVPNSIKKDFQKKFHQYLKDMGRPIVIYMDPYKVDCPNCTYDLVKKVSSNKYNIDFKRPLYIFPGTSAEKIVYPVPFNVTSVSGVQYDPAIPNPKILQVTNCPVCNGSGVLIEEKTVNIHGLVTWNPKEPLRDLSPGKDGESICRIKTFEYNYATVKQAKYFIVDGVECKFADKGTPRVKGLGADHIVEFYLQTTSVENSVSTKYDSDPITIYNPVGTQSDQAPESAPTIPPHTDGEDVW